MEDGSLPSYLFIVLIVLIMVFNGLVVACKRALDYIDRNVIKERLEEISDVVVVVCNINNLVHTESILINMFHVCRLNWCKCEGIVY